MSFTLWFTGLSGAGKTTLSKAVYRRLLSEGIATELLDGDIVRSNFAQELDFSKKDRDINVKRLGFIAHLLNKHGVAVIVAAISPYEEARAVNRTLIEDYHEIFVDCPLEVTERRDVKGLYAKAREGKVEHFTGVSDPYQPPVSPEVHLRTHEESVEQSLEKVYAHLQRTKKLGTGEDSAGDMDADFLLNRDNEWRERLRDLGFMRKL